MSTRYQLGQLSAKYARVFGLGVATVHYEKWDDNEGKVWADGYPVWTLNKSEDEHFPGDPSNS